jgi:hypothetical protein
LKKYLVRLPNKTFKIMSRVKEKHGIPYLQQILKALTLYYNEFFPDIVAEVERKEAEKRAA